jgi:glycosyltransferase involved in cell wall biosynthesis
MERTENVNITFFTPTLQRTGSELVLFDLLGYLPDFCSASVVCKFKGPLYDGLPSRVRKDYIFREQFPSGLFSKIYHRFFSRIFLESKLKRYKDSFWYINTIVLPDIIDFAVKNNIKFIVHVHELQQMFALLSPVQLNRLVNYPELIITNSNASKMVVLGHKPKADIKVCYPAVDTQKFNFNPGLYKSIREKTGVNPETFLWVMAGTLDENKNPALFIRIASELKNKACDFKMMWVGSANDKEIENNYRKLAIAKGLADRIIWITQKQINYFEYLNSADGFVLTSKLESFSLVTIEALLLGLPVIANNCKGVNEILNNEYGKVIENENAGEMSYEMGEIMAKRPQREIEKGRAIARKFELSVLGEKWKEILIQTLDREN